MSYLSLQKSISSDQTQLLAYNAKWGLMCKADELACCTVGPVRQTVKKYRSSLFSILFNFDWDGRLRRWNQWMEQHLVCKPFYFLSRTILHILNWILLHNEWKSFFGNSQCTWGWRGQVSNMPLYLVAGKTPASTVAMCAFSFCSHL